VGNVAISRPLSPSLLKKVIQEDTRNIHQGKPSIKE
jgi:hypothetical protein